MAATVGITASAVVPAHAAGADPIKVGSTSPCQDVVVLGAQGSGQTYADNNGFGPEAWLGLTAYAGHMEGYEVGYYTVPYPSAPADPISLTTRQYRQTFFDSIDSGVYETLKFLEQRVPRCQDEGEHYVLMGYSQGAMVMHRALWQLTQPKTKYSALGGQVLPRLDGVLAIADGDRVANQGGVPMDTAGDGGYGIWWGGAAVGATSAKYKPLKAPIPNLPYWPATRFHSVCHAKDLVCDASNLDLSYSSNKYWNAFLQARNASTIAAAKEIHESYYWPTGDSAAYVQSAATNIAKTSKALNPKTGTKLPTVPVRVGQKGMVTLAPDGRDVLSVQWLSNPIPNAEISPGMPTIPATLTWSPTSPGIVDYSVRVSFTDGTSKDIAGALQAFAIPAPSLSAVNLQTQYSTALDGNYPYSTVTFDVVRTADSDSTPLKGFSDREDPATDFYSYTGGDANGNNLLDVGEAWSYWAKFDWGPWEPGTVRTRTVLVSANDTTGAGAWTELELPVTLTR
ncbi:cutinase family protein [Arthrobacter sp. ISL-28]|uniref:cutinase family protein n=1 Tax=Arthrobacter sp. ISL-28 TaxID=2819108 RepID=UPI001BED2AE3|nr:cutinase family protein [Arthrobacter sp. ISL-28]MBT2523220.1 cutinase family protein [Arthrobacter sp. ISL-28]